MGKGGLEVLSALSSKLILDQSVDLRTCSTELRRGEIRTC